MGLVADFIIWLASVAGPAATAVIGAFWNLIIATGMHVPIYTAILPAALQNGYDAILYPRHRGCSLHHACHRARLWPAR